MPPDIYNQQPQPVPIQSSLKSNIVLYIFYLTLALAFVSLGFLGAYILNKSSATNQLPNFISSTPSSLHPEVLELLKNPIFTQWSGSVQGTVSEKTLTTLTLERDGQKLIFNIDKRTKFLDSTKIMESTVSSSSFIPYEQVLIGDTIRGNVEFEKDGKGNLLSIIGKLMTIQRKL